MRILLEIKRTIPRRPERVQNCDWILKENKTSYNEIETALRVKTHRINERGIKQSKYKVWLPHL